MVTPPPDVVNIGSPAFTVRATDLADAPGVVENCLADLRPPGRKLLSSVGRRPIIFQKNFPIEDGGSRPTEVRHF